jgi:hypothetical protein
MDAATVQTARDRAQNRCEYCRLPQSFSALLFHIEHVVARQHGGTDALENLALACPECNFRKGTNLSTIDLETGQTTALFHPRRDIWHDHFSNDRGHLTGKTAVGRGTVVLLKLNSGDRLRLRVMLFESGQFD